MYICVWVCVHEREDVSVSPLLLADVCRFASATYMCMCACAWESVSPPLLAVNFGCMSVCKVCVSAAARCQSWMHVRLQVLCTYVCACVCMRENVCVCRRRCSLSISDVCLFASATYVCVFVCVRERENLCVSPLLLALNDGCMSIYKCYTHMRVRVCAWEKERGKERVCACMCVCERESLCVSLPLLVVNRVCLQVLCNASLTRRMRVCALMQAHIYIALANRLASCESVCSLFASAI